ncbi:MAG: nitroreductase family protein [Bacteroidaceae bacterium]|nr:nitroreductase family protein [Bacteroidaceae bacterium]
MKNFLELAQARQSDRSFEPGRTIDSDVLNRIVEAGRLAPSACNGQPWHFTVITDSELLPQVGKATSSLGINRFVKDSSALILITHEPTNITSRFGCGIKDKDFPMMDLGIASAYITLAAEDEGVGSCILGWFDEKKIKQLVGIPEKKRLMLIVALGYAAKPKRKKIRKEWNKVVSFEKY